MLIPTPHRYTAAKWQARIIPFDKQFKFADGTQVASLYELKLALNQVSDEVISQHVSQDRHDIASWVQFVVMDHELADLLRSQSHRWGMIVALERHMMRTLSLPSYVAQRWLEPSSNPLRIVSDQEVYSIQELADILPKLDDTSFSYHLERVPNDFSQWILLDVGDLQLAELVAEATTQDQMARYLADHLEMLKEAAEQE